MADGPGPGLMMVFSGVVDPSTPERLQPRAEVFSLALRADGRARGGRRQLSAFPRTENPPVATPSLVTGRSGRGVVVWSWGPDFRGDRSLYSRPIDARGRATGRVRTLSRQSGRVEESAVLAVGPRDQVLAVWVSRGSNQASSVRARRIGWNGAGQRRTRSVRGASAIDLITSPGAAASVSGWVVTWAMPSLHDREVYSARLDSQGRSTGRPRRETRAGRDVAADAPSGVSAQSKLPALTRAGRGLILAWAAQTTQEEPYRIWAKRLG